MENSGFNEELGKAFLPKRFRPTIRKYLESAGVYSSPYSFIALLFHLSLVITFFVVFIFVYPPLSKYVATLPGASRTLILFSFILISWALLQLALMFLFFVVSYFFLDMKKYRRELVIEEKLPEYLTIVSTNLKAGLSLDAALFRAIRPEFGVLSEEMTLVSKKMLTGHDIDQALTEFSTKYRSPELRRSTSLIISESEVGGKISRIIDDIVTHLKQTRKLKRQMLASVVSYVIFISAIIIFISPVLFALSYNLLSFMQSFVIKVSSSLSSSTVPSFLSGINAESINSDTFKIFGYFATGTVAFLSSIIVSIIQTGDVKGGIKFIPVYLILSLVVYHFSLVLLSIVLGGIII